MTSQKIHISRRNFFERYRTLDDSIEQPQRFSDCAKVYNECEDAERYDNVEQEEEQQKINSESERNEEDIATTTPSTVPTTTTESNDSENVVRRKRFNRYFKL